MTVKRNTHRIVSMLALLAMVMYILGGCSSKRSPTVWDTQVYNAGMNDSTASTYKTEQSNEEQIMSTGTTDSTYTTTITSESAITDTLSTTSEATVASTVAEAKHALSVTVAYVQNSQKNSITQKADVSKAITTTKTKKTTTTTTKATTTTTATKATTTTTTTSTTNPTQPAPVSTIGKYIVGYYAGWSRYSGFTPDKINASKLTHLNYAFAKIDTNLKVALGDPTTDLKNFEALRAVKANNSALKTLISVGGWTYSTYFSDAALTSTSREIFAQSCLDFILTHGFDGIDLDWEYPVSGGLKGNSNRPEDKQNFTYLLQAIRDKLNQQSQKDGRKYYLTIAGGTTTAYINKIEILKVANLVDYLFIMGYDMHGSWESYSDFNAPLYYISSSPQYKIGVHDAINAYLNTGMSPSKLVLGMPFYGHQYTVNSSANDGLFSTYTSFKSIGYDTVVSTYLSNSAYKQLYHSVARVPYLFGNSTFISYENTASIAEKVQMAKSRKLAGVGAWELSHDRNGVLLGSAYSTIQ